MLARNPKTGGLIRVMTSNSSIWKNRKTLVYMNAAPGENAHRWSRWDIIISNVDQDILKWNPHIVVLTDFTSEVAKWLKSPQAKETKFILISRAVVDSFGEAEFHAMQLGNVLCLEELCDMYPFLGEPWTGTLEDAVLCASIVFRYQRLIGISKESSDTRLAKLLLDSVNIRVSETSEPPEPLVLIQQYYIPLEAIRAKEIDKCLVKNLNNPLIDRIYLFVESKNLKLPKDEKLIVIYKKSRITYADCIELIQTKIGKGSLVAFANADIYLDNTWSNLWSSDIHGIFLALLRWDEESPDSGQPELWGPRADSQDTWAIHSDSVMDRTWNLDSLKIPFGTPGCDNAILVEFLKHKFRIVNPAMSLRTIHVHKSDIRKYDPKDIVDRPVYMHVNPTGIHELNPMLDWSGWASEQIKSQPLHRPLKATNPKAIPIFCSQLNREADFTWSPTSQNTYSVPDNQEREILLEGGAFVSCKGLVYKYSDLCVGTTDIQKRLWSENQISHLMPAQMTEAMMCFPLEDIWLDEPALYTLHYLSRVIKQHRKTPEASFWCKKSSTLLPAFRLFKWSEPRGHLLQYNNNSQAFANKVVGLTSHDIRIMPSDIEALRSNMFDGFVMTPILEPKPILTLVADEVHIKGGLLESIEAFAKERSYEVRVIYSSADASVWAEKLSGASRVILSTSKKHVQTPTWAWAWMAPPGSSILELQEEREPSDSLLHLSAAAGLDWTLLQYPRATPDGFKKIVMKEIEKWLHVAHTSLASPATQSLPLALVPPRSMKFGFFGHKGDSFRELVDMWAEQGFVERVEDPTITQCWLGGVGEILLYDRPTWTWLEKASGPEQTYKLCLAGNPSAAEKPNSRPWTFWPRQPRLVEAKVEAAKGRGFQERTDGLIFYGRIENDIQGQYRQNVEEWSALCDKFSMPKGAKEPYALSPDEYLTALQNAKFGLCLRGYGPKCNREIELLAMGTVPIVTPGVDIDGYMEPLVDGVHVICVLDAADAKAKMAAVTEEQWTTISKEAQAWWKRNDSASGSWQRTSAHMIDG